MKKILVIEDEPAISKVLKAYLTKAGYEVIQAFTGESGMYHFRHSSPSLVVLDIMLPDTDGIEILKAIREQSSCPVIMLTALSSIQQKLTGLESGADDYIAKPFVAEEVVARVKAVLRRPVQLTNEDAVKYFGSLIVNFKAHSVSLKGIELQLTPRDLSLLLFLAKHPNQTFTREQLIERVWGIDYDGSDRAVDLAIKRIRKALYNWPTTEGEIRTFRGLGYQFYVV